VAEFIFKYWTELMYRTALSETLGAAESAERDGFRRSILAVARSTMSTAFEAALRDTDGKCPVHEVVSQSVQKLRLSMRPYLVNDVDATWFEQLLTQTEALNDARRCQGCFPEVDQCNEITPRSHPARDSIGRCTKGFRDLFAFWDAVAHVVYSDSAPRAEPVVTTFRFQYTSRKSPHGLATPIAIHGMCEVNDIGGQRSSAVMIEVGVSDLDWPTLAALPYVVTHELICHAHQGCSQPLREHYTPLDCCFFAEGWMDMVAVELFQAVLNQTALHETPPLPTDDAKVIDGWLNHGIELHRARYENGAKAAQNTFGRMCRTLLQRALSIFVEEEKARGVVGIDSMWHIHTADQFALALNATRAGSRFLFSDVLDRLVSCLNSAAKDDGSKRRKDLRSRLWVSIRDFCQELDLNRLKLDLERVTLL